MCMPPGVLLLRLHGLYCVQPDKALTPLDWTLWPDLTAPRIQFPECEGGAFPCKPQLLQSHTELFTTNGTLLHWHHVVAVAVRAYPLSLADLWPALPLPEGWSYAVIRRQGLGHACIDGEPAFAPGGCAISTVCATGGLCLPTVDTSVGFWNATNLHLAWALYTLAPRMPNGWALLGGEDPSHIKRDPNPSPPSVPFPSALVLCATNFVTSQSLTSTTLRRPCVSLR
jgi:hypothetical protein